MKLLKEYLKLFEIDKNTNVIEDLETIQREYRCKYYLEFANILNGKMAIAKKFAQGFNVKKIK